jgi:hypothetical protein
LILNNSLKVSTGFTRYQVTQPYTLFEVLKSWIVGNVGFKSFVVTFKSTIVTLEFIVILMLLNIGAKMAGQAIDEGLPKNAKTLYFY